MTDRYFMHGVMCAAAGFGLAQIAPHIAGTPGREPVWAAMVLTGLLLGWVGFTAAAFIFKPSK